MKKVFCVILTILFGCLYVTVTAEEGDTTLDCFEKAFGKSPSDLYAGYRYAETNDDGEIWVTNGKEDSCAGDFWIERYGETDTLTCIEISLSDTKTSGRFLEDVSEPLASILTESCRLIREAGMGEGVWLSDITVKLLGEDIQSFHLVYIAGADYDVVEMQWLMTGEGVYTISKCTIDDISSVDGVHVDVTSEMQEKSDGEKEE